jgi:hypoxanthine phosphoribosyltransferase
MNTVGDPHHLVPLVCEGQIIHPSYGHEIFGQWTNGTFPAPMTFAGDDQVAARLKWMAKTIEDITWRGCNRHQRVCIVSILKGGLYTQYQLLQYLPQTALFIGHIGRSSYREGTGSSKIKATYHLDLHRDLIQNSTVWLIDDIADTGKTLAHARDAIAEMHPARIYTATLINKYIKSREHIHVDVSGFFAKGDPFVVGCGMGLGESYRNLHGLYEVQFIEEK